MKHLISLAILLSFSFGFGATESTEDKLPHETITHVNHETQKIEHTDWNKVFPQPVANKANATPPPASEILSPAFLSKISGTDVTLKWKSVEGAQYHLQVAKDPNFKWLVVDKPLITVTEYPLTGLQSGQQYFWRVYTQNPANWPSYTKGPSVKSSFEVQ